LGKVLVTTTVVEEEEEEEEEVEVEVASAWRLVFFVFQKLSRGASSAMSTSTPK
jgi:hypothetical protein